MPKISGDFEMQPDDSRVGVPEGKEACDEATRGAFYLEFDFFNRVPAILANDRVLQVRGREYV